MICIKGEEDESIRVKKLQKQIKIQSRLKNEEARTLALYLEETNDWNEN